MHEDSASEPPHRLTDAIRFFLAFLRSPRTVGAVLPSSGYLARAMLAGHDLRTARAIVELGPGPGPFTRAIERAAGPHTTFIAIELDGAAAARLQQRHPRVRVRHDSAEELRRHLLAEGHEHAEAILSGIPWASMPPEIQRRIMSAVQAALAPRGVFSTFTYVQSPYTRSGAAYARLLAELFVRVEKSPIVWRNVPPAFVYRCTGSR